MTLAVGVFLLSCITSFVAGKAPFTLDDVTNPTVFLDDSGATWVTQQVLAYKKFDQIYLVDFDDVSLTKKILVDNSTFKRYEPSDWQVSPSTNVIALSNDRTTFTRHRVLQKTTIVNTKTKSEKVVRPSVGIERILLLVWNHGSKADDYAFVSDNDIYYQSSNYATPPTRLTFNNATDIYNGVPDWMYEEFYAYFVRWFNNETLLVIWSNRIQNIAFFSLCNIRDARCRLHHTQTYYGYWMAPDRMLVNFVSDDKYFVMLPKFEVDGFRYIHIASLSVSANKAEPVFLTKGQWEVLSIVGYDKQSEFLYFIAARPIPRQSNLYRISTKLTSDQEPLCLSCWLVDHRCTTVSASFSKNGKHYILTCLGPSVPKMYIRSAALNRTVLTIEDNEEYVQYVNSRQMPVVKYLTYRLPNGFDAFVKLMLPPNFKQTSTARIPLVLKVYAGPETLAANEIFSISYETHLITEKQYAVAYIDARGAGNRGSRYLEAVYKHLGDREVDDQIAALSMLLNSTAYLDRDKVAVWGWSYGGMATARMIEKDKYSTFKCAAAVAPVSDLRFYDAAYTERYMGLDKWNDNDAGYKKASALQDVNAFGKGKFLLAHGTADDNVHLQNTMMLVEELQREEVQFQFMMYPNQRHAIGKRRHHLFTMLDNFLHECFTSPHIQN